MKSFPMMSVSILAASLVLGLTAHAEEVKPQTAPPAVESQEKSPVVENGSKTEDKKLSKKEQKKLARAQKKAEKKANKKKNKIKS